MNLWGVRGDWAARRNVLVEGLRELRPDVLALQEAIVRADHDQVRDVLGYAFHLAHHGKREPDGQGISIASRWPIIATREIDLAVGRGSASISDAACALVAELDAPFGPLLLVNHFPNWELNREAEREAQAVRVAREIDQLRPDPAAPVVVAGDLDADPAAASIRFWTGRQSLEGFSVCYRDCWEKVHPERPGHTFTRDNPLVADEDWPFGRIDYVLVRCGVHGGPTLAVDDCRLVFDRPRGGVQASDHYGVLADLRHRP